MNLRSTILWCALIVGLPAGAAAQRPDTRNPHGRLAQPCDVCHSPEAWTPARISARFDHGKAVAGFPLDGAHATVTCRSCHTSLTFKGAARDCVSCHNDPHQGELGTSCARCHTPRSFVDRTGMTRAHQLTRFPLTGAHIAVDCESCHTRASSGQMSFVARSTACSDCHLRDYQATRNPDHAAGGFSQRCEQCHAAVSWQGARVDHSTTRFPLTGAHLAVNCAQCHGTGAYGALPTTCVSCHQTDYNNTNNPSHQQAQFPTDCTACHTTVTWTTATFNHNNTAFPLTGAHVRATCDQCHGDGVYQAKPTTCVSCHQTDYTTTTDPNHQQAQFSTDCAACHTTTVWTSATFVNHDAQYFPIYSGAHRGRWSACSTCHVNPSDYRQFDCLSCHARNEMDSKHAGRSGYSYDSQACYRCHPDGRH